MEQAVRRRHERDPFLLLVLLVLVTVFIIVCVESVGDFGRELDTDGPPADDDDGLGVLELRRGPPYLLPAPLERVVVAVVSAFFFVVI